MNKSPSEMVREFHEAFGLPVRDVPKNVTPDERKLRVDLMREELYEYVTAAFANDLVEVADGLADIVYIAYGTALCYGIDLDAVIREVHRSNMAKLDRNGKPIYRSDGKVLKPKGWQPPDIIGVLAGQGEQ